MEGSAFIQGVWCGVIFGAAAMLLVVSLIFENSRRRQKPLEPRSQDLPQYLLGAPTPGIEFHD